MLKWVQCTHAFTETDPFYMSPYVLWISQWIDESFDALSTLRVQTRWWAKTMERSAEASRKLLIMPLSSDLSSCTSCGRKKATCAPNGSCSFSLRFYTRSLVLFQRRTDICKSLRCQALRPCPSKKITSMIACCAYEVLAGNWCDMDCWCYQIFCNVS